MLTGLVLRTIGKSTGIERNGTNPASLWPISLLIAINLTRSENTSVSPASELQLTSVPSWLTSTQSVTAASVSKCCEIVTFAWDNSPAASASEGSRHRNIPDHNSQIAMMGLVTHGFMQNVRTEFTCGLRPLNLFVLILGLTLRPALIQVNESSQGQDTKGWCNFKVNINSCSKASAPPAQPSPKHLTEVQGNQRQQHPL